MSETTAPDTQNTRAATIMESSFLDYAMSVITDRALPDARDGLKPVHRRILYAMHSLKIGPNSPHKKSARVIGEVIGKYHPHGDSAAYEAAVRLAQPWAMQHPLIDGQGNFGSIDGDSAAAMRYTEMRLSRMGNRLFTDIEKATVDFRDNFDGAEREPEVLPLSYPQLWVNGGEGIAVGMATSIPPHSLRETTAAFLAWMDDPQISIGEIARHMPAPDFPTGGTVHGIEGYRQALQTGRGRVKLRAKWTEEERRGGKRLVITEIPYLVNKARLVEAIAELVREKKLDGVADLRDESNKHGIRIVLDIKKGTEPEFVALHLLAMTNLEVTISYNVMALVAMKPRQLSIYDVFHSFHDHRIEVIQRRTQHDLDRALERLHLLEGFLAALDRLDETIATIRGSSHADEARERLQALLGIDEVQAQAILDLRLQRLTGMQIREIRDEHDRLTATVADLRDILARPERQGALLREELLAISDQHGIDRRTEIAEDLSGVTDGELIPVEDVILLATRNGYVKRLPVSALNRQNRGTRGRSIMDMGDDDLVTSIHTASTHDHLLAVTDSGQVHAVRVWEVPESGPGSRGRHYRNVFSGLEGHVVAMLSAPELRVAEQALVIVTAAGYVKRTLLSEFANATRQGGVNGVALDAGDAIVAARLSASPSDHLMVVGDHGKAIRFSIEEVRPMGRVARGVRAMKLGGRARVIAASVVGAEEADPELACISETGVGKRTAVSDYPVQGRGGQGVVCFNPNRRSGELAAATLVREGQDVVVFNDAGGANRIAHADIPRAGRNTAGAAMIRNGTIRDLVAVPRAEESDEDE